MTVDLNVAESSLPDAVLRPVRDGNAFESTVEHLATAIRLGVFAAGERLPAERDLAERLRVSRATLREAIGALRQTGLVETHRGRTGGTVVTYTGPNRDPVSGVARLNRERYTDARISDALSFRRVVEPGAAGLAASAPLSAEARGRLVTALDDVGRAEGDGARRVCDARFHLAVATLSGSLMLVDAVACAQAVLTDLLAAIPVLEPNIVHSDGQHQGLVRAILGGDAAAAHRIMEEHCDATSALLRGLIE